MEYILERNTNSYMQCSFISYNSTNLFLQLLSTASTTSNPPKFYDLLNEGKTFLSPHLQSALLFVVITHRKSLRTIIKFSSALLFTCSQLITWEIVITFHNTRMYLYSNNSWKQAKTVSHPHAQMHTEKKNHYCRCCTTNTQTAAFSMLFAFSLSLSS